jgi:hypothetical protein
MTDRRWPMAGGVSVGMRLNAARTLFVLGCVPATMLSTSVAHGDPSVTHTVKYIVYSDAPASVHIYYRDADPPNWADYSHNPYQYSPKVEADIGPGAPWTLETALSDPDRWAMVVVTNERSPDTPGFRCELMVDGAVVSTHAGPKGALCSLRHW